MKHVRKKQLFFVEIIKKSQIKQSIKHLLSLVDFVKINES